MKIKEFAHSHQLLNELTAEVQRIVRTKPPKSGRTLRLRRQLVEHVAALRDELLRHFADEEEGLFPFVRWRVPALTDAAEGLRIETVHPALVHFTIGGIAVATLAYLAAARMRSSRLSFAGDFALVTTAAMTLVAAAFRIVAYAVVRWPGVSRRGAVYIWLSASRRPC